MSLEDKIAKCIEKKQGNKEFALFYTEEEDGLYPRWRAEIGNPLPCVSLGEISGEVRSDDVQSPLEAVEQLLERIGKSE